MRKTTIALYGALSAAVLAVAGVAIAEPMAGPHKGEMSGPSTRAEAEQKAAEAFAKMDANGDGAINQEDHQARVAEHFASLDSNSDGSLSLAEFSAGGPKGHGKMRGDKDGMGHMGHGGRGMMMSKMADADKNGQVTAAEFTAAALTRFDQADANKDGTVTVEERKAAMKAMRESHKESRTERRGAQQAPAN
jgi:hypothetical protein